MATLTLAPMGLIPVRSLRQHAGSLAMSIRYIEKGTAGSIGIGDLVETRTGAGDYGYVGVYTAAGTHTLGVFCGVHPYYDATLQRINQRMAYTSTMNPAGSVVPCWVCDDPTVVFVAQLGGTNASNPGNLLDIGGNIDVAQNGAPNSNGISTAYLDATTYHNTTATLPLRIVGLGQSAFNGYSPWRTFWDPAQSVQDTNNYLEVVLNTSEFRTSTGI